MAATASISPSLKSFKTLALLGDLATLLLLLALLRENNAPFRWAGFYAFNPAVLIAFAAEAHFDSLMGAALLAAILAALREKKSAWLWLGIAIQIKLVCLILVPIFLIQNREPRMDTNEHESAVNAQDAFRKIRVHSCPFVVPLLLFIAAIILPSLPFLSALPEWVHGVTHFAGSGAFNAPLFTLLAATGLDLGPVRALCLAAFAVSATAIVVSRWRGLDLTASILWMLGALLACSPIVHFWYLAWLLPLAAMRPSFAWITASITIAGYFLAWETQDTHGWWGYGHGIAAAIWLPWFLAAIAQHRFLPARIRSEKLHAEPFSLSIVIPAMENSPALKALVSTLRAEVLTNTEIIIATCDPAIPEIPSTKTILSPRGRGNQIAAGISAINAPWILIAHADATPPPGFYKNIRQTIAKNPDASLLVCGQRFDRATPATLIIEALNEVRLIFGGVAFGDQTMVIRRSAIAAASGFPAQPLMEDVEASLRLATKGHIVYLGREWIVSANKWEHGFATRFRKVIRLTATYQLARIRSRAHAAAVSEWMYEEYYPEREK